MRARLPALPVGCMRALRGREWPLVLGPGTGLRSTPFPGPGTAFGDFPVLCRQPRRFPFPGAPGFPADRLSLGSWRWSGGHRTPAGAGEVP